MSNFLESAAKENVLASLAIAVRQQLERGNINLDEVRKFVALIQNTQKLKAALRYL
jgi:hypothetical protein